MKITNTETFKPLTSPLRLIIFCHICDQYEAKWLIIIDEIFRILSCDNCRTVDVDEIMNKI